MTSAAVEIRPLRSSDFEAWLPLWRGYQAFYKTDIAAAVSKVTFERLTSGLEPMGGALAWAGDRAVGMVHHIAHRSCWTVADYCYLQDLYVEPELRGSGVGRLLIEYVYRVAKERGLNRVHWLTHETNTEAMKLYDRIADRSGFVQYRKMLG